MRIFDTPNRHALLLQLAAALALLTRLPLPRLPDQAFAEQGRTAWAWPLAGLTVVALALVPAWAALWLGLPAGLAAGLALGAQVMLSGAMHEDGLADTADGLWGGFSRKRRLDIMRDSRIGTYGVLALILSLGLRWGALTVLLAAGTWGAVVAAAVLSRALMAVVMTALPPARGDGLSSAVGAPGATISGVALGMGLCLATIAAGPAALLSSVVAAATVAVLAHLARARIGGQTGDIVGAAQQVAEIAMLLSLTAALA